MIRLRTSTLESYRRVVAGYGSEKDLAETLERGQWVDGPSNWMMQAGTAWHRALAREQPDGRNPIQDTAGHGDLLRFGEWCFDSRDVEQALTYRGPGLCEVTARQTWTVGGRQVQVEGTADWVRGLGIRDAKTKFTPPDPLDYVSSLQWRFYLLLQQAQWFTYDLFSFKDPDDFGYCAMKDVMSFRLWRYPQLDADCSTWLHRFLGWAAGRGLLGLLDKETP
jgi:hypothetical protein